MLLLTFEVFDPFTVNACHVSAVIYDQTLYHVFV